MTTLKLNGQTIIDTFQNVVCKDYNEAIALGVNSYGWSLIDILDRTEKISVKLEDGEIIDTEMSCITVNSGSEDYIYHL